MLPPKTSETAPKKFAIIADFPEKNLSKDHKIYCACASTCRMGRLNPDPDSGFVPVFVPMSGPKG